LLPPPSKNPPTLLRTHLRPRGFGFIEFKDQRDADEALYHLDRSDFMGREISVSWLATRAVQHRQYRQCVSWSGERGGGALGGAVCSTGPCVGTH
jgi:hypothetical protein